MMAYSPEDRRAYYAANKDRENKTAREYYQRNAERLRRRAWERAHAKTAQEYGCTGSGLTWEQWQRILEVHAHRCFYCGAGGRIEADHLVPLSQGGPHDPLNIVPACKTCNSRKKDRPADWKPRLS